MEGMESAEVQNVEAPEESVEGSQPQDGEETVEDVSHETDASSDDVEQLPFGKHPRWQKMVQQNRDYRQKMQRLEDQIRQLDGPATLHKKLSENPQKLRAVLDMLEDRRDAIEKDKSENVYEDWEPEAAKHLKRIDALEKRIEQLLEADQHRQQTSEQRAIQGHLGSIDNEYEKFLARDGYIKDGKPVNERLVSVIDRATRAILDDIHRTERRLPTFEDLQAAYDEVVQGLSAHEKQTLRKTVNSGVPPSGSNRGSIPKGKTAQTEDERIRDLAASL